MPVEPLYIPAMAMRRRWAMIYAALLTLGCVLGALATYWVAAAAFEPLVQPAMHAGGIMDNFEAVREDIKERGFWALFIVGVSPIPFQLGTVAAGVVGVPPGVVGASGSMLGGRRLAGFIHACSSARRMAPSPSVSIEASRRLSCFGATMSSRDSARRRKLRRRAIASKPDERRVIAMLGGARP